MKELDAARRRVTELESQLAAVESEGTALDAATAREMDQMKQMIEFQDEQILVAVDALDKRDVEAKRAAEMPRRSSRTFARSSALRSSRRLPRKNPCARR